jgi:hypothetical protein
VHSRSPLTPAALCAALACLASPLDAQLVRGRALAGADSAAVHGVVVQLATSAGALVSQALSDQRGGFTLKAPGGGTYRLRALRIGFRPTLGETFAVPETGIVERSIVLTGAAVTLAATQVTADERCAAGSDPGSLGFRAWEQARTALSAALLTRQSATYEMQFVVSELERAVRTGTITQYEERERATSAMRPFTAVPLAHLRDSGYVTRDRDGAVTYAAPDEEVLLSEEFAVSHCIRARPSSGDDLVLGFEPTRDRRLSDITGSLVLSRSSGELRVLSYEYANVSAEERAARAGGELVFLRFPSGGWMVQRWLVRAPVFESHERRDVAGASPYGGAARIVRRLVQVGVRETLGEAFSVRQNGVVVWEAPVVTIDGSVVDDSLGLPVAGTDVRIAGRATGTVADDRGRFRLEGARQGELMLQITAPYALRLGVPPRRVHVSSRVGPLALRVPNLDQAIREACRAANDPLSDRAPRSIVRGIVRDAHGGRRGITDVSVTWLHGTHAANEMRERRVRSTAMGDYTVCGVEPGKELLVRAFLGSDPIASGTAIIPPGAPWVVLDLASPAQPSR